MKFDLVTMSTLDVGTLSLDALTTLGHQIDTTDKNLKLLFGKVLLKAREFFSADKEFGEWRCTNFGHLDRNRASELMNLARFFNEEKSMEGIGLSVAYELSAPKNAKFADEAYEDLMGKNLKGKEALEIIDVYRPAKPKPEFKSKSDVSPVEEDSVNSEPVVNETPAAPDIIPPDVISDDTADDADEEEEAAICDEDRETAAILEVRQEEMRIEKERTLSNAEFLELLKPIIKELAKQGKRNPASIAISEISYLAQQLKMLSKRLKH